MTGERFDLGSTRLRVAAAADEATVLEAEIDPGGGAPPHVHTREDETLVVLEGSLVVDAGEPRVLRAGEAAVVPRGVRHGFRNDGASSTRVLFFCSPGGLERYFRDVAAAATDDEATAAAERAGLRFG